MSDSSFTRNSHEGLFNVMRAILTKLDKLENHGVQSYMSASSFKKVWIPKENTIRPLRGSSSSPT